MNDSNNNAKENEKIFKSYASNDSSVGLEENKPIFFCGKNERDMYIMGIQFRLGGVYQLENREYVYPEKVKGIVDKCVFTNGIDNFVLYMSIYSYHNMSDFVPASVQAIIERWDKESTDRENRNQNALETVKGFFKKRKNATEFLQITHTNYFISKVLKKEKYDSRIIADAASYLGELFNNRLKEHDQDGNRDFGDGSKKAIEYFKSESDAERFIDECVHSKASDYVDVSILDIFNEWFEQKYGKDLALYEYYYFWYGQETPKR
ncbi:MAG: hypothetical protein K5769_06720 [Pseudobutyrivibrio sp.]|nr:hypothetical protein [Pseudobutyrivibrio sp.]